MAEKFDIKVHHRGKDGRVVRENHYALHIVNGVKIFERPIGSGMKYYENGEMHEDTKKMQEKKEEQEKQVDKEEQKELAAVLSEDKVEKRGRPAKAKQ
jgi:hypothetical protein